MNQAIMMAVGKLKNNPNNPRIIKDEKFTLLVQSLKDFPQMLNLRPIVVNEQNVVLGGNMRLKAAIELGLKEVPVVVTKGLTKEQEREFIVKDNVPFGQWDFEMLANEWDIEKLAAWGLDVPQFSEINLDEFFEAKNAEDDLQTKDKIVLVYPLDEIEKIKSALMQHGKTYEDAVCNLLGV
jgi:nitrogen fixation protein